MPYIAQIGTDEVPIAGRLDEKQSVKQRAIYDSVLSSHCKTQRDCLDNFSGLIIN
jgi:hypothetical protein